MKIAVKNEVNKNIHIFSNVLKFILYTKCIDNIDIVITVHSQFIQIVPFVGSFEEFFTKGFQIIQLDKSLNSCAMP